MAAQFNKVLLQCLYDSNSISDAILKFGLEASKKESTTLSDRADILLKYQKYITEKNLVERLREATEGLVKEIRDNDEFRHIRYTIIGRRKSLLSLDDKMTESQAHGQKISINDILGIRIILQNIRDEEYLIEKSDGESEFTKLAVFTIEYLEHFGFTHVKAENLKNTKTFKKDKHPELYVPEKPILPEKYREYAKDYVYTPKENGYQTLQGVMHDSDTEKNFEWQIRTLSMHVHSDILSANHAKYKEERRAKRNIEDPDLEEEELDYSKIHMYGFAASGNSEDPYRDFCGLIEQQNFLTYQRVNSIKAEL